MGPILNPLYWALWLVFLLVAVVAAIAFGVLSGSGAFLLAKKSKVKFIRIGLPIAVALTAMPIVFCLTFGGLCNWSLSGPPSPREKPNSSDIVGVWWLSEGSLQTIQAEGYQFSSVPKLEFMADGSFRMTDIPDIVFDSWEPKHEFCSGTGTWAVHRDRVNDEWDIEVYLTKFSGSLDYPDFTFELYGETPPYRIYRWAGDPDAGLIWVFEKR